MGTNPSDARARRVDQSFEKNAEARVLKLLESPGGTYVNSPAIHRWVVQIRMAVP